MIMMNRSLQEILKLVHTSTASVFGLLVLTSPSPPSVDALLFRETEVVSLDPRPPEISNRCIYMKKLRLRCNYKV